MKYFKRINYSLMLIFFCLSCTDNKKEENLWNDKTVFLKGAILTPNLDIYLSRDVQIFDSLLIIHNIGNNYSYSVYELMKNNQIKHVFNFGQIGEGPNEFINSTTMQIDKRNLYIFDKGLLRNYVINCNSLIDKNIENSMQTEYLKNASLFNRLIKIEDKKYVCTGTFTQGRFAFCYNDSIIYTNVPFPEDGINASNIQKSMAYQGCLVKHPSDTKLVYAAYYGCILEIYDINNFSIHKLFSDISEFPHYEPKYMDDIVEANYQQDNKIGFFTVSVTSEYIYALYCGKKKNDERIDYANILYVYDWKGTSVKRYILDKDISGICVDKSNNKAYGLYTDPNDDNMKIVCYTLMSLHNK